MSESVKREVLILNQMAGPITLELAEDLGDQLGPCTLFTGHPDAISREDTDRLTVVPAPMHRRGNYVARLTSWLHYLALALLLVLRRPRSDYLLLFSNPPLLPLVGYLASRVRGQRYSVVVHDIYPDTLLRLGLLSERGIVTKVWRSLNRRAYERADTVMTLGECMADHLERQFDSGRTSTGRVAVIYPWADTDVIRPIPKHENWFAQEYGQVDKLTVMYSGNMGVSHDLETMLAAAEELRDLRQIHFLFIGEGAKWPLVERTVRTKNLQNVTLLPWQPEEVLPYSLATSDVSLVSLDDGIEGLAVPSKAVYAMAAGSALLAICKGKNELRTWITEYDCGVVVEPGDLAGMLRVLRGYLTDQDRIHAHRERARQAGEREFSRKVNSQRMLKTISPLIQDHIRPR